MEAPTMIQQFGAAKSSRGGRLGRSQASTSTMTQYGYGTPGANITVSPTFSNIGNPNVQVEGMSVGDISLGAARENQSGQISTPRPTPSPTPTPGPSRTPRPTDKAVGRQIKQAVAAGGTKTPKVSKGEIKDVLAGGAGIRQVRNAIEDRDAAIGKKAQNFLNRQLEEKGAKKLGVAEVSRGLNEVGKKLSRGEAKEIVTGLGDLRGRKAVSRLAEKKDIVVKPKAAAFLEKTIEQRKQEKKGEAPKTEKKPEASKNNQNKTEARRGVFMEGGNVRLPDVSNLLNKNKNTKQEQKDKDKAKAKTEAKTKATLKSKSSEKKKKKK